MNRWLIHFLLVIFLINDVLARDLGKAAATYDVAEEGFVSMMKRRLSEIDISKHQVGMKELAVKRVNEPEAVKGIVRTKEAKEFYYDPTYVVNKDIILPCGKILYKAGTKVNPLDYIDFDRELIFIDGRDRQQVEWLKEKLAEANSEIQNKDNKKSDLKEKQSKAEQRIILVGGKILELQKEVGETLYFDQVGELTSKFNIKQVPALVGQEGKRLKISEIKV